jgi:hypothetical protein
MLFAWTPNDIETWAEETVKLAKPFDDDNFRS